MIPGIKINGFIPRDYGLTLREGEVENMGRETKIRFYRGSFDETLPREGE